MPITWSPAHAKNWSVLPPFIAEKYLKTLISLRPGSFLRLSVLSEVLRLKPGWEGFSEFCYLFLSPVRVPASPAGSRNREFILESGTSRQLWERSGGRRRGAQCQWQRGKHSSRGGEIPLIIMIVSVTLVSGNFWFQFFAVLTRMYIRN